MSILAASTPAIETATRQWFVVHTLPHREFDVRTRLAAQAFPPFLPTHRKTVRHARRFHTTTAALFPRYLFVALDLNRDRWRSVNGTIGVSRMIMAGDVPKPVPAGVIEHLIEACNEDGVLTFDVDLQVGQPARLMSGPFAGQIGTLTKLSPIGRVQLLLDTMGSRVFVSAKREALAPVA
jgi:transcription antitermination factor NusG